MILNWPVTVFATEHPICQAQAILGIRPAGGRRGAIRRMVSPSPVPAATLRLPQSTCSATDNVDFDLEASPDLPKHPFNLRYIKLDYLRHPTKPGSLTPLESEGVLLIILSSTRSKSQEQTTTLRNLALLFSGKRS